MRWEYLLLGTDKPQLAVAEEEDDGMNDEDMENLVGLHGVGAGGGMGLPSGQPDQHLYHVCVYWRGMGQRNRL